MASVYPVALDLEDKPCLVVGGGIVAEGKLDGLLRAGARITVVNPEVRPEIARLAAEGRIKLMRRPYQSSDVESCFLVIAATDDRAANAAIAAEARAAGALVNSVDDPPNCDFFAVALVRRGDLQLAISTNGRSPAFARWLRERLDSEIPAEYGDLLAALGDARQELRAHGPIPSYDRWRNAIDDELLELLRRGEQEKARARLVEGLAEPLQKFAPSTEIAEEGAERAHAMRPDTGTDNDGAVFPRPSVGILGAHCMRPRADGKGNDDKAYSVSLVGAGPGDPGLITVAGLTRLRAAEVVAYDRLVDRRLLDEAPTGAELICVGKTPGQAGWNQGEIEALLIERARAGPRVVRLKGGDPFVFGRGGEELAALVAAGIPVEVIPGVSAAVAVPAAAGIPVTQRGLASAITIVTGHEHEDPSKPGEALDWAWLARAPGSVVILMGLERIEAICARLIAEGRAALTPAAAISAGTLPEQRIVISNLGSLPTKAREAGLRSPTTIVIGEVVRIPEQLAYLGAAHPAQPLETVRGEEISHAIPSRA